MSGELKSELFKACAWFTKKFIIPGMSAEEIERLVIRHIDEYEGDAKAQDVIHRLQRTFRDS